MPEVTREQVEGLVVQLELFIEEVVEDSPGGWGVHQVKKGLVDALVEILVPESPSAADEFERSGDDYD